MQAQLQIALVAITHNTKTKTRGNNIPRIDKGINFKLGEMYTFFTFNSAQFPC